MQSIYRQRSIVDKKINRKSIASSKFVFLQKNNLTKFDSIDIGKNQSNYKIKVNKKNYKFSKSLELSNIAKKSLKHILQIYNN